MKYVFSNISTIAHLWANQSQDSARTSGNNFYFNGDTIYSYGSHFPIAILHTKDGVTSTLFTLRGYSNTTAKHIAVVRQADWHNHIYCLHPEQANNNNHKGNIQYWIGEIGTSIKALQKARKPEIHKEKINGLTKQLTAYLSYFGIEIDDTTRQLIDNPSFDALLAYSDAELQREQARQEQARAKEIGRHDGELIKFRAGEINRMYTRTNNVDYLRYDKDNHRFTTSQAVQIPYEIGRRFYNNCIASACNECNKFMDYYVKHINSTSVTVGCHTIMIEEIKNSLLEAHYSNPDNCPKI